MALRLSIMGTRTVLTRGVINGHPITEKQRTTLENRLARLAASGGVEDGGAQGGLEEKGQEDSDPRLGARAQAHAKAKALVWRTGRRGPHAAKDMTQTEVGRIYRDSEGRKRTIVEVRREGKLLGSGYVTMPWGCSEEDWLKALKAEAQRIEESAAVYED